MRRGVRAQFRQGVSATNHQPNRDADMPLATTLTNTWDHIQDFLFPMLRQEVGPAGPSAGRPACAGTRVRHAEGVLWCDAKPVLGLATTSGLIERLAVDATLRRLCGWERASAVPSVCNAQRPNAMLQGNLHLQRKVNAIPLTADVIGSATSGGGCTWANVGQCIAAADVCGAQRLGSDGRSGSWAASSSMLSLQPLLSQHRKTCSDGRAECKFP